MPAMPPVKKAAPAPAPTLKEREILPATHSGGMDHCAKVAEDELKPTMTLVDVANWWKRHYAAAGHKRLARALMKRATP